jgi:hypothetical protein
MDAIADHRVDGSQLKHHNEEFIKSSNQNGGQWHKERTTKQERMLGNSTDPMEGWFLHLGSP